MNTYEWITTLLVPATGVISWFAGARKRRNDSINDLQQTINMLVDENARVYNQLAVARKELSDALVQISTLNTNQERLMKENAELKANQEQLMKENAELKNMIKQLSHNKK